MKNFISYVIQDAKEHKHYSEIIDIKNPPYSYSSNPQISEVLKWAEEKQSKLLKGHQLIILSMYKLN